MAKRFFQENDCVAQLCLTLAVKRYDSPPRQEQETWGSVALIENNGKFFIASGGRSGRGEDMTMFPPNGTMTHGERLTMWNAQKYGYPAEKLIDAVAGGNVRLKKAFINSPGREYTCLPCAQTAQEIGIRGFYVTMRTRAKVEDYGWKFIPTKTAVESATSLQKQKTDAGISRIALREDISDGHPPLPLPSVSDITPEFIDNLVESILQKGHGISPHLLTTLTLWPELVQLPASLVTKFLSGMAPEKIALYDPAPPPPEYKWRHNRNYTLLSLVSTPKRFIKQLGGELRLPEMQREEFLSSEFVSKELRRKAERAWADHSHLEYHPRHSL